MTTPIEQIQADIAAMKADIDMLKAAAASAEQANQQARDWLHRTPATDPRDPKPAAREERM